MQPRSVSLSGQLIVTFAVLLVATVAALTLVAYNNSLDNLTARATDSARTAAQTREALLRQLFDLRVRRATGFLRTAETHCTEQGRIASLTWVSGCLDPTLEHFLDAEGATAAVLTYRGRAVLTAGETLAAVGAGEASSAVAVWKGEEIRYLTRVQQGDSSLLLEYGPDDVTPVFEDRTGLGDLGELILFGEDGRPLTALRGRPDPEALDDLSELAAHCRDRMLDVNTSRDYRGERAIVVSRPVASLRGACLVAFVNFDEAMTPAAALRLSLLTRGVAFVIAAVVLSLIGARHISGPVRRLARTAKALQAGDFSKRVPIEGPAEVQGLARALAAMSTDLSELIGREQTARREAEAANRSKDQFLAMLSHELRTPLTAILGWAHTLRHAPHDPERAERAARAIERSAESQRRLIEDLLDVTGIAAGRVRINLTPTPLAEVVESAVEAVRPRAAEKGVGLATELDDRQLLVHGDGQRLQQVVWNLVWNAVKFTPAQGTVSVRVRAAGTLAEITVRDTGVGIGPEFLPHVFGWFRREDREMRGKDEGLGLGLALVRQLVELHGGTVRAESAGRNCGSTFVVMLPLLHGDAARPERSPVGAQRAGAVDPSGLLPLMVPVVSGPDPLTSVRVLVVDDDQGSREAVRVLLEEAGADVTTAASAPEARRYIRTSSSDVLVSDIAMEQESGYTLIETLRAEGLTLPSIALTGFARREDADRAYAAGFDVHLPKPVDPDVLISVVAALVRGK